MLNQTQLPEHPPPESSAGIVALIASQTDRDEFCAGGKPKGPGDQRPSEPAESGCTDLTADCTGESS